MTIAYLPSDHAVHGIRPDLRQAFAAAQASALERTFATSGDLVRAGCRRAGVPLAIADAFDGEPLLPFADLPHPSLATLLRDAPAAAGLSHGATVLLADQIQLLRAFAQPDAVIERVRAKVERVVAGFPRGAAELECGRNPGDVMDPFLLGATQFLLCGGSIGQGLEAAVLHKCMMMLEDLVGNLHQDVIGSMRGNVRVPEPQGEAWDLVRNPFPGADIAQPPLASGEKLRLFQVKNKTGSAKGGDGKRLGDQFGLLMDKYAAETYYIAIFGRSLQGHRSMAGVLGACRETVVAVGETALKYLTRSEAGAELLMRVYQSAFRDVARASGYTVREIATAIALEFRHKLRLGDDELLDGILQDVTRGGLVSQDSRYYRALPRGGAKNGRAVT